MARFRSGSWHLDFENRHGPGTSLDKPDGGRVIRVATYQLPAGGDSIGTPDRFRDGMEKAWSKLRSKLDHGYFGESGDFRAVVPGEKAMDLLKSTVSIEPSNDDGKRKSTPDARLAPRLTTAGTPDVDLSF